MLEDHGGWGGACRRLRQWESHVPGFSHACRRISVQDRYESLTQSVQESSIVEPSVSAPATGKKVSIPNIFNSPSPSPTHVAMPRNGAVSAARTRDSPVPSPRIRRKVSEGSPAPVPGPKTARKVKLKPGEPPSALHQMVGNGGQRQPQALENGQPQALGDGQPQALGDGQQPGDAQDRQQPQALGNGDASY